MQLHFKLESTNEKCQMKSGKSSVCLVVKKSLGRFGSVAHHEVESSRRSLAEA
jgi:hypothetical protein